MTDNDAPKIRKIGPRRVQTTPRPGQGPEPRVERDDVDESANDERLKADKPPHY